MKNFSTKTELMPHQAEAIDKVLPTRVSGLFMDMGTGKTRTTIELAKIRAVKIDHVIWCCPVSLKETIRQEILKHTDCEDIYVFDNKTAQRLIPNDYRWYIVGIESLSSSDRVTIALNSIITENTFIVVDESSYIKGHNSMRTKRITFLSEKARYRTILTGTPLSQGIVDLYSQMYFLSPKILGYKSFYSFANNHLEYHPDYPGLIVRSHNVPYLAEKIKPYVYQCTKDECLSIPHKLFDTRYIQLTEEQETAYEHAKDVFFDEQMEQEEEGHGFSSMAIFHLFTSLQTICCGFIHEKDKDIKTLPNNRINALLDAVHAIPDKEKVLIWGKYVHSVNEIVSALQEEFGEKSVAVFNGTLSPGAREHELDKFKNGARFMVATQSCGGHGLNLQFCCYQIFYANGFKYSERLQAEDRCHRHGQHRKVTYIDIYAIESIDERIRDSLNKKGDALSSFRDEIDRVKKSKDKKALKELIMKL